MPELVRFHLDPICPWAYQTSRWVRQLVDLDVLQVEWGVFSLEIANTGTQEAREKGHARSANALRTMVLVRDEADHSGVSGFTGALGRRVHEAGAALDDDATIAAALTDAGLPAALADGAAGDDALWQRVVDEHTALVERTRSFGVPTIVLDGGDGPAIFGPVISDVPTDADAVALWQHVTWLTRYENFSELKRDRVIDPDLESFRAYRARQAAEAGA
ncbi:MAG: DsbA family protein [Egibacteraceae bacterium]